MGNISRGNSGQSVLLINMFFYPDIAPTAQLGVDLAKDLVDKGFSVSVVAGRRSYLKSEGHHKLPVYESIEGIKVYRVISTSFEKKHAIGRVLNYLTFYIFALTRVLLLPKHDVVITMSTPPYISYLGLILKRVKGSKFVFWVQDIYPEVAFAFGVIKSGGIVARVLSNLSLKIYREADKVIVIGEKMCEKVVGKGLKRDKIEIIHNWADPGDFVLENGEENFLVVDLKLEGKFILLYSGNMGVVHDFETIKDAMVRLKDREEIAFVFIGEGVKRDEVGDYVKQKGISNVYFLPYQSREMLKYSIGAGDVILITQASPSAGMVVPSKIYSALAAGKPILAVGAKETELFEIVDKEKTGLFVECGDSLGFQEAITRFVEEEDLRETLGKNGKILFEKSFSRPLATARFMEIVKEFQHPFKDRMR